MAIRPDQFDAQGYLLLTAKEWREKHRDFKSIRADGTKVCNWLDPKSGGTWSVPVRIVKTLPPLTNPRRKTMARRRRSTRHRRDSRGRFLPRGRHRATRRSRRTRRSSRSLSVASSGRSASPRRILTLLGIGAAAIMLTQKLTSPAAAAQRAAALAAKQSSGTAPRST